MTPKQVLEKQKIFFFTDKTKSVDFRISQLKKLKSILKENENILYDAIYSDFGKSKYEAFSTEISLVYSEINSAIKNLPFWSHQKKVSTNLVNFPAKSYILKEPYGNTLIIGAWNYPLQLALLPSISSLSAGNTVILKPSELAQNCSVALKDLINKNFDVGYFNVIEGGVEATTEILKLKFDKIFFTGSTRVGKIVYEAAAKNLTPVILELGGKSPAIIFDDANLKITAKRIAWGKFLNAGQTCIAPDYILVDEKIENKFLNELKIQLKNIFKKQNILTENYVRIINQSRFDKLVTLINRKKIFYGGTYNKKTLHISPTILSDVTFKDKVMREEIFGPILPVIKFKKIDEVILKLKKMEKPLSFYVFSKNKKNSENIFGKLSFGGGALNDTLMHVANCSLPFGGVGASGIGSYHGENGFESFSHSKSIIDKPTWFEPFLKYPPYTKIKFWLMKLIMK